MASDTSPTKRQYLDRGVQTSPGFATTVAGTTTDNRELERESATVDISLVAAKLQRLEVSGNAFPALPEEQQDAIQQPPSLSVATRALARHSLAYRRPMADKQNSRVTSSRIVSLPETAPAYSEKRSMRQTKMRVVSMPETSGVQGRSVESSFSDQSQGSIIPDSEAPGRIRVFSGATELPYTPSPPSSPDSVLITGSQSQISERFLREDSCTDLSSPSIDADEDDDGEMLRVSSLSGLISILPTGWTSWARSPPRPIPALHGPLSLPYARCPS